MFGIANQLLAVLALALVTTWLVNTGRSAYAWVTVLPRLGVIPTRPAAGSQVVMCGFPRMIEAGKGSAGTLNMAVPVFVMASVLALDFGAATRWLAVWSGGVPTRRE